MTCKHSQRGTTGAVIGAVLLFACSGPGIAQNIYDAGWGADYSNCAGARQPQRFRAGNDTYEDITASGVITCLDDGDAYVYAIDYMNFSLTPGSSWKSGRIDWVGAGAQRAGRNGTNEWIFDEVKPVKVHLSDKSKRVAITNLSFRVPKATLNQARGFNFYMVGGGIFWTIPMLGKHEQDEAAPATATRPLSSTTTALTMPAPDDAAHKQLPSASQDIALAGLADWGAGKTTCEGEKGARQLKTAAPENDNIIAYGIIACTDAGDAFVYTVEYINFSLAPTSKWKSAHLEWFGAGAQRAAADGSNDWIYDEVKPIQLEVRADAKRAAVANISFRVPKSVIAQARGFGFYVVGGGIMWSILLL